MKTPVAVKLQPPLRVEALSGSLETMGALIQSIYVESEFLDPMEDIVKKTLCPELSLPCGIFLGKQAVGFFSIDFSNPCANAGENGRSSFWLESFMISGDFQGKGYGKAALNKIFGFLKNKYPDLRHLNLTVNFRNNPAKALYLQCGFVDTRDIYRQGPAGPQHIFTKRL